ncbi:HNH endonuclease [Streptomyces phage Marky]|nr:HNH endonuclease [Streptomyces phage Marky]
MPGLVVIRVSVNARFVERYGMTRSDLRHLLYQRQEGLCAICARPLGRKYLTSKWVNLDHRRPRSHGGPDTVANLDLTHRPCNTRKADSCDGCTWCAPDPARAGGVDTVRGRRRAA